MTALQTDKWVKPFKEALDEYNDTIHSATKTTPNEAWETREVAPFKIKVSSDRRKPKFEVGDVVRISRLKGMFEKGYKANWSTELFKISKILPTTPITYRIEDLQKEEIKGSFYEPELQKSKSEIRPEETFLVDKIIMEKGTGKNKAYFVSWKGYPEKFNSWVKASDFSP